MSVPRAKRLLTGLSASRFSGVGDCVAGWCAVRLGLCVKRGIGLGFVVHLSSFGAIFWMAPMGKHLGCS